MVRHHAIGHRGAQCHVASRALIAHARPSPASSTTSCSCHPVGGSWASHHHQRSEAASSPSSSIGTGHSSSTSPSAPTTQSAPNRPPAAPRRRPCAPPLAPAHPNQATASVGGNDAQRADGRPSARNAPGASPSTVTTSARPFDDVVHGSTSWRTASSTASSSTRDGAVGGRATSMSGPGGGGAGNAPPSSPYSASG